jgi:hypothetical protein
MCSSYANSYLITILKTDLESPPTGLHLQIRAKWYKILGAIGPRDVYTTAHVTWADLGLGLVNHGCQVSVFKSKSNCGDPAYRRRAQLHCILNLLLNKYLACVSLHKVVFGYTPFISIYPVPFHC